MAEITRHPVLTARGRETRLRIIEETGRQILADGIGGTTLDTVRAATLTSKSQLFHYFPGGKAELVREVAQWEGQELFAAQEPEIHDLASWGSWERWRAGLEVYYFDRGRWACPISTLAQQAAPSDETLAESTREGVAVWASMLAQGVERMQASGAIEPTADAARVGTGIVAAIMGGLALSQPERDGAPLAAALDLAFRGLRSLAV
jgi:AcrR family transcriptional regulator